MHRPGVCKVVGDTVVLDGTTIEELEGTHLETLRLVLERANATVGQSERQQRIREERERTDREEHQEKVRDAARKLRF